ncbi:MAG: hypothetical protein M3Y87_25225 [Myxococcota bacterium]|nr:hypothetical protein [Myxococcota bacterium]
MNRSKCWWMVGACVVVLGCGDGGDVGDAGMGRDARVEDDAQVADGGAGDAGPGDAGAGDGGVEGACEGACEDDEACVRGVCLATCGGDLSGIDAALAAGLAPVVNVCRMGSSALDVIEGTAGALRVYELSAATVGATTTFTLSRWSLDAAGVATSSETIATATHEGHAPDAIFVGGYLDVSDDESGAIFGYTTTDAGILGGVFDVEVGDGSVDELAAPGNYDGAWLDDARWLVNGLGLGGETGQGLYLHDTAGGSSRRAVDELGAYSGSVAVLGDVVIAGAAAAFGETWPDGVAMGDRVFVLDAAAVGAEPTISGWDDALAHFAAPSTFELIGGMRLASVVYDDAFMIAGFETRSLDDGVAGWTIGAPESLLTGGTFTGVVAAGETRVLLDHAGGLLLVALE